MPDAVDCEGNERKETASESTREFDYSVNRKPHGLSTSHFSNDRGGDIVKVADMNIAARSRHSRP